MNCYEIITMNLSPNEKVRKETLKGKEYRVVPVQMIKEGVLNGSSGSFLYPEDELEKAPTAWNMKPLVSNHPPENVQATDPVFLENNSFGMLMGSGYNKKTKKLGSEAWIDVEQADAVDTRIVENIDAGTPVEVSTGLFIEVENKAGEFNGVQYDGVARNHKPDHLAILLDDVGACSLKDGAGLLVANKSDIEEKALEEFCKKSSKAVANIVRNALSFSNTETAISDKLHDLFSNEDGLWVQDVFESFFIFRRDGSSWKLPYTTNDMAVGIGDVDPVEVVRVTEYRTVEGSFVGTVTHDKQKTIFNTKEVNTMKTKEEKLEMVEAIVNHEGSSFVKEDTEFLQNLDDDRLQSFFDTCNAEKVDVDVDAEADQELVDNNKPTEQATLAEYVGNAPPEVREVLVGLIQSQNAQKVALVEKILNSDINKNSSAPWERHHLVEMNIKDLKRVVSFIPNENDRLSLEPDYSGMGISNNTSNTGFEPLGVPEFVGDK